LEYPLTVKNEEIHISKGDLEVLIKKARRISWSNFGKTIRFYSPSFIPYRNPYFQSTSSDFHSISITGKSCALQCKHCGGKLLKTMIPATTPKRLIDVCRMLKKQGSKGVLISGGCLQDGSMPLETFLNAIAHIKNTYGLKITVHTGIIESKLAKSLRDVGVDATLIDIIGSDDTIREIYGLNVTVEDYDSSLKALHDSKIHFIPHVIVGLHYGKIKGEFNALKMISKYEPSALVIIALIPLRGTLMEGVSPPTPEDIVKVLAKARILLPDIPLSLGCMRPTGKLRTITDNLAIDAGVNAIAFPEEKAVEYAKSLGLEIEFLPVCCSWIYEDIMKS